MTYLSNHRSADARRRNGIIGQTQRYLDTLGNWGTYRDIHRVEEIPERLAQVTAAYFGLKGLAEGRLRLSGLALLCGMPAVMLIWMIHPGFDLFGLAQRGLELAIAVWTLAVAWFVYAGWFVAKV